MTIHDKHAFKHAFKDALKDAQSLARIAFFCADKAQAESFWAAAMKSLKSAYGVK